ncbi:DNA replication protein DnaC [Melghiribacillus thermohalophilus]|uniref:DNA replication protein DnaC n=2 Tax=Melghiribacillus thermohalophilus TaxID=1324956 RepID=A0A4R3N379_9BACI|nr:DNA replication protein DnaC [Melghiribacillus thermohalophilus]
MRICKCREDKSLDAKLQFARIPQEYRQSRINNFEINLYRTDEGKERAAIAKRVAANFVANYPAMKEQGKGLYFYSYQKGSGKTRLSCSIANALVKKYKADVRFIRFVDLLNELKNSFSGNGDVNASELIEAVKNIEVLVIDDLGVEKVSEWVEEVVTSILDHRLNQNLVTIITSNSTIEELDKRYQQGRVRSRVEKMTFPVWMPEESIRSLIAQQENEEIQDILFR